MIIQALAGTLGRMFLRSAATALGTAIGKALGDEVSHALEQRRKSTSTKSKKKGTKKK